MWQSALIPDFRSFKTLPSVTDGAYPHFHFWRFQDVPGFPEAISRISLRIYHTTGGWNRTSDSRCTGSGYSGHQIPSIARHLQ